MNFINDFIAFRRKRRGGGGGKAEEKVQDKKR